MTPRTLWRTAVEIGSVAIGLSVLYLGVLPLAQPVLIAAVIGSVVMLHALF